MANLDWMADAACNNEDPELFFSQYEIKEATEICNRLCPVQSECLNYSLDENLNFGVWGGLSESERIKIRRNQVAPWAGAVVMESAS